MVLHQNDRILFTGCSVTDRGRRLNEEQPLGSNGYVVFTASRLLAKMASPDLKIFNRGIGGNCVSDLLARIDEDCLALHPTVVSILIGVNDTSYAFRANNFTQTDKFEADYRTILSSIRDKLHARIILLEPFLLPVRPELLEWRAHLNPRIEAVRRLAGEFGADILPLDELFAQASTKAPADFWAADGVHPTISGHALIAQAWLEKVGMG